MNDDLKAYIDGELPPDAAERLRATLANDPALAQEADAFRELSVALRRLPEPEPVGRAETLAALRRRPALPLWRAWAPALAACAAVVVCVSSLNRHPKTWIPASYPGTKSAPGASAVPQTGEAKIPLVRRDAFVRYVRGRGGQVRRDGEGLRAFYPESAHAALKRRFLLPEDLPWPTDGLKVRLTP